MDCSVCGLPGAWTSLESDDLGNSTGGWVHATCACHSEGGVSVERFWLSGPVWVDRGHKGCRVFKVRELSLQKMLPGKGRVYFNTRSVVSSVWRETIRFHGMPHKVRTTKCLL